MAKVRKKTNNSTKKKFFRKEHMLYWISGIVVLTPLILILIISLSAASGSNQPVVGNRFNNSLEPKIKDSEVNAVKDALANDLIQSSEVNLKSATLRITCDAVDDISIESVNELIDTIYNKVGEILPIDKYFSNTETIKMYDLEIHIYNYIPDEEKTRDNWIYKIRTKIASNPDVVDNLESSAKDSELANDLLKPVE